MEHIDKILRRYKKAKNAYHEYYSVLKDCYTYALPDRGYFDTLSSGKRTTKIYDSTAILGIGTYADKVQQNIVPPWRKWFMLIPGSGIEKELHEQIQPALDKITDIIYDNINHSNFNTVINEALQDVAISTGVITCEEGDGEESYLTFKSISLEEVVFEQSQSGIIENFFREYKIKVREIEESIIGAKLTPSLKKIMAEDENAEITLIEAVIKEKKKFKHCIIFEKDKEYVFETLDDSSPYIAFRERVTSKGLYGMGRIIQLLNDIKVLNKIQEMDLQNAGLAISGVYTATDDGVLNPYNVRLIPGTVIPVGSNNTANPSLRALERSGDFNVAQIKIDQKQELINKTLFGTPLGSITKTPVRTATEIDQRANETFEMTSAAFSRFQTELLERLIKRIVDVLQKAGRIAPVVVDGNEITIKFTSTLARQQDQQDVSVIVNYAQTLAATGIPPQDIGRKVKFENVPNYIAENMGFPSELIRSEEEVNIYDAQKAQEMQAQMRMAAQQGAQGV